MTEKAKRPILMLVSSRASEAAVLECGTALARSRGLPARILAASSPAALGTTVSSGGLAAARAQGPPDPGISALVSGFAPGSPAFRALLRATLEWRVPGVFVRGAGGLACERVLVPTGGGHHTLRQMGVARDLARTRGVPAQVLRVVCDDGSGPEAMAERPTMLTGLQARSLGIDTPLRVTHAADALTGIVHHTEPQDLLVVGAPNAWRAAAHFEGSLPEALARRLDNPLAMVVAPSPNVLALRDVMWEALIRPNLRAADGGAVIGALIDTLVRQYQIPVSCRDDALRRALQREAEQSTAVGCETAFPHVRLPGFRGVLCCLGICPEGVYFGGPGTDLVRFVFLFVAAEEVYDDYLAVLGQVARRLAAPAVRAALAACRSSREVLDLLAPPAVPAGSLHWDPGQRGAVASLPAARQRAHRARYRRARA